MDFVEESNVSPLGYENMLLHCASSVGLINKRRYYIKCSRHVFGITDDKNRRF